MAAFDAKLYIEGIKGESHVVRHGAQYPSLGCLLTQWRRHGGVNVITAVARGARDAAAQRTLQALDDLGVPERPKTSHWMLDHTGLSLIALEAQRAGAQAPRPPSVLLLMLMLDKRTPWLLLPTLQRLRAASRPMPPRTRFMLFASDGNPVQGSGRHEHERWIEIAGGSF